jgi:hypothetical protein
MAFASPCATAASLRPVRARALCARRAAGVPRARRAAAAPPRMAAEGAEGDGDGALPAVGVKTKAEREEEQVAQTWQGNAWFAVTMVGMMIGVAATLARDFVPSGGPAVY